MPNASETTIVPHAEANNATAIVLHATVNGATAIDGTVNGATANDATVNDATVNDATVNDATAIDGTAIVQYEKANGDWCDRDCVQTARVRMVRARSFAESKDPMQT